MTRWRRIGMASMVVSVSLLTGLGFAEAGVRTVRWWRDSSESSFRLAPTVYGQFDRRFGQRFVPGSRIAIASVVDGKVAWCSGTIASANADGLGGRATLADTVLADVVMFTTGDSFSYWQREALTIPDIAAAELHSRTGLRVVNLNYARGTYGMLQMLTIAAELAPGLNPDVVVIQFITDDLTRARWWTTDTIIGSRRRWLLSASPTGFDDFRITNDEFVVDDRATDAWCRGQMEQPVSDDILREATAFVHDYRRQKGLEIDPWSLTHSYLYDLVRVRLTGRLPDEVENALIPRVSAPQFAADSGYQASVRKLRELGVPVVLIHIPTNDELEAGEPLLGDDQRAIWAEMEAGLGTPARTWFQLASAPAWPPVMDLEPFDAHPNLAGLTFYGRYVARVLEPVLTGHSARR